MKFVLKAKTRTLKGVIELPASKSISNRVLIIRALSKTPFEIINLSAADDTTIMERALGRNDMITDVGPAGTTMRFLTALYATQPGEKILTGSERMKKRPIGTLVEALRQLGANITYIENEGYPPLRIEGRRLHGGEVNVMGDISSQFITALMLIGPTLPQQLVINIQGDPLSMPYIAMTSALMKQCGAQVKVDSNKITIEPGRYRSKAFVVEQDWSAAAFWMAFATLSRNAKLTLSGLKAESVQGDSKAVELFEGLGVASKFTEGGLEISKGIVSDKFKKWDFKNHPDLVQPAAIAVAGHLKKFEFSGLNNLRLKETDRVAALQHELAKIGIKTNVEGFVLTVLPGKELTQPEVMESYEDHRMVMALAALSMIFPEIYIRDPMVVSKSYPQFWKQVEKFVDVRPHR